MMANEVFFCSNCGAQLTGECVFCPYCGHPTGKKQSSQSDGSSVKRVWSSVIDSANKLTSDGNGDVNLHLRDIVDGVFKKHSDEERDGVFICGTSATTPPERDIAVSWPKPWLYSRVFAMFAVTFLILTLTWSAFQNTNVIPGIMFIGALTVPFTGLVFFFEVNAPRNISLVKVIEIFFVGGVLSLFAALLLFLLDPSTKLDFFGAIMTGIIEEVGKAVIVIWLCRKAQTKYILNGLLIGAAVGAGFAVFETAGYALNSLLSYGSDAMMDTIYLRAMLALGGHIVWTATAGAAYVAVKGENEFDWSQFKGWGFWKLFLVPVILHSIWDMPIPSLGGIPLLQIILTVVAWIFVLLIINNGLAQITKLNSAPTPIDVAPSESGEKV